MKLFIFWVAMKVPIPYISYPPVRIFHIAYTKVSNCDEIKKTQDVLTLTNVYFS